MPSDTHRLEYDVSDETIPSGFIISTVEGRSSSIVFCVASVNNKEIRNS